MALITKFPPDVGEPVSTGDPKYIDMLNELKSALNGLTFRTAQTFAVAGEIRVPSGQVDVIPPMFVSKLAGQVVKLVKVRCQIAAGTSATFKVQRNGSDATGFTGIVATTTAADTDPADITLADNDVLQLAVTAVSGTPQNLTVTLVFEHSF
jgi:hypothetical protein